MAEVATSLISPSHQGRYEGLTTVSLPSGVFDWIRSQLHQDCTGEAGSGQKRIKMRYDRRSDHSYDQSSIRVGFRLKYVHDARGW